MKSHTKFIPAKLMLATLLSSTSLSFAMHAHAATDTPAPVATAPSAAGAITEVTITAQKRTSTVQKTAASVDVVTSVDLQARGVTSLASLAQGTPGVSLKSEGPSQTEVEMRGMTSSGGNSATVGFYLDDIPLTGSANAQNGHVVIDPDLYDLNRIEMLRGPQGTLFGAGSMGGTVRLITNQPDPSGYHVSAESILSNTEGGSVNHNDNLMVNMPLVKDTLTLRVVGSENYTSGWIDRDVLNAFPATDATGTVRGDVASVPVSEQIKGSNAYQVYSGRVTLLWQPTPDLTITPSVFSESSKQNGISAYDSISATNNAPGAGMAHYQPFDVAEPLTDRLTAVSLNVNYDFKWADLTSSTAYWTRRSTQLEDDSEAFNNKNTGVTLFANFGAPFNSGYYGPTGSGTETGYENDPSSQFSEELHLTSKGDDRFTWVAGAYYSRFTSTWNFTGTTPNFSSYMDLGSGQPATTPNFFSADEPTTTSQYAVYGNATYAFDDHWKIEGGSRFNHTDYSFSSCITGWGSALGAATPSCTGLIKLSSDSFNPKVTLSYTVSPDLMAYGSVASGFRPGGANSLYPTTGSVWGTAFATMGYTGTKWPSTYKPDQVLSYEIGEKGRFLDRRLTINTSLYYEDWRDIQLEAYPDDWALNINGEKATIYGAELDIFARLGAGFDLQLSGGYVHDHLDGGPHWVITPVNQLPEVAPESGTAVLSYTKPIDNDFTFTAKLENSYTGRRYSLAFPEPDTSFGAYVPLAAYDLTNVRMGVKFRDAWTVSLFVNNVFDTHAQLESLYPLSLGNAAYNRIITNQPLTAGIDLTVRY